MNLNKSVYYGAYLTDMSIYLLFYFFTNMGTSDIFSSVLDFFFPKDTEDEVQMEAEMFIHSIMSKYKMPSKPNLFASFLAVYVYTMNIVKTTYVVKD